MEIASRHPMSRALPLRKPFSSRDSSATSVMVLDGLRDDGFGDCLDAALLAPTRPERVRRPFVDATSDSWRLSPVRMR